MKKVLMVGNDESVKGGITTVINQFRTHKWENVSLKFIPTYKDNNAFVKIIFFIIAYIRILFYLIFHKPNTVHIHMSYKASFTRAYLIHKLCKRFKVKDIIHLHGSEFKKWYDECKKEKQDKIKRLLRECTIMVVLGNEWKRRIYSIEPKTNILVVNNTVKIQNESSKYNKECFNILYLGVLIKRKGLKDLLKAIRILEDNNILKDNVKFLIAGSGEEEQNLKKEAVELKIDSYVDFFGWIDSNGKEKLLKKSQLMVLPSYNEGLPMCILEAMSFGIPVIATNVGDIPEVVKDSKNGFLFNPGDCNTLASQLEKMITSDEKYWNNMSKEAKEIIEKEFSDEGYFKTFEEMY